MDGRACGPGAERGEARVLGLQLRISGLTGCHLFARGQALQLAQQLAVHRIRRSVDARNIARVPPRNELARRKVAPGRAGRTVLVCPVPPCPVAVKAAYHISWSQEVKNQRALAQQIYLNRLAASCGKCSVVPPRCTSCSHRHYTLLYEAYSLRPIKEESRCDPKPPLPVLQAGF